MVGHNRWVILEYWLVSNWFVEAVDDAREESKGRDTRANGDATEISEISAPVPKASRKRKAKETDTIEAPQSVKIPTKVWICHLTEIHMTD